MPITCTCYMMPWSIDYLDSNDWSIRIQTTHNLSLWIYEYFWIILLHGHLVYFILKILAWEICNYMKWEFDKKVIIYPQRQLCMVRIFMDQTMFWQVLQDAICWPFYSFKNCTEQNYGIHMYPPMKRHRKYCQI